MGLDEQHDYTQDLADAQDEERSESSEEALKAARRANQEAESALKDFWDGLREIRETLEGRGIPMPPIERPK